MRAGAGAVVTLNLCCGTSCCHYIVLQTMADSIKQSSAPEQIFRRLCGILSYTQIFIEYAYRALGLDMQQILPMLRFDALIGIQSVLNAVRNRGVRRRPGLGDLSVEWLADNHRLTARTKRCCEERSEKRGVKPPEREHPTATLSGPHTCTYPPSTHEYRYSLPGVLVMLISYIRCSWNTEPHDMHQRHGAGSINLSGDIYLYSHYHILNSIPRLVLICASGDIWPRCYHEAPLLTIDL